MNIRLITCLLVLVASPAFAADVDGKWTGSVDTPNGPIQANFDFKTEGTKLTCTYTGADGSTLMLSDGTIDGSKISFAVAVDIGGDQTTFKYTGVVTANTIQLHTEYMGQAFDYTVKKAG